MYGMHKREARETRQHVVFRVRSRFAAAARVKKMLRGSRTTEPGGNDIRLPVSNAALQRRARRKRVMNMDPCLFAACLTGMPLVDAWYQRQPGPC